jgi:hypothetical protein
MKESNKDANGSKINFFYISINWAPIKICDVQKTRKNETLCGKMGQPGGFI